MRFDSLCHSNKHLLDISKLPIKRGVNWKIKDLHPKTKTYLNDNKTISNFEEEEEDLKNKYFFLLIWGQIRKTLQLRTKFL